MDFQLTSSCLDSILLQLLQPVHYSTLKLKLKLLRPLATTPGPCQQTKVAVQQLHLKPGNSTTWRIILTSAGTDT